MYNQKIIDFKVVNGNITLNGKINLVSKTDPVVIFIPGVSGKALTDKFDWIANVFTDIGYNFVRFNFRGYEEGSNFEEFSLENELEDFGNLLEKLNEMGFNMKKYGVVAKSMGALKALLTQDSNLKCTGLLAPAISLNEKDNLSKTEKVLYKNIGEYFEYKLSFNMVKNSPATIVFYGDKDQVVKKEDTENLIKHLSNPKESYCIQNEDHSLEEAKTKLFIREKITPFFKKHL